MGRVKTAVRRWLGLDEIERQNQEIMNLLSGLERTPPKRVATDWKALDRRIDQAFENQTSEIRKLLDVKPALKEFHLRKIDQIHADSEDIRRWTEALHARMSHGFSSKLNKSEGQKIEATHLIVLELHRLVQQMDVGLSAGFKKLLEQFVLKNAYKKPGAKNGTSTDTN